MLSNLSIENPSDIAEEDNTNIRIDSLAKTCAKLFFLTSAFSVLYMNDEKGGLFAFAAFIFAILTIIGNSSKVEIKDEKEQSPNDLLYNAVREGDFKKAKDYIRNGVDIYAKNKYGLSIFNVNDDTPIKTLEQLELLKCYALAVAYVNGDYERLKLITQKEKGLMSYCSFNDGHFLNYVELLGGYKQENNNLGNHEKISTLITEVNGRKDKSYKALIAYGAIAGLSIGLDFCLKDKAIFNIVMYGSLILALGEIYTEVTGTILHKVEKKFWKDHVLNSNEMPRQID